MKSSKRFVVLESVDHTDVLMECVGFLALTSPAAGLKTISHREAGNIVYYLARDIVDARLAHKHANPENAENVISILFGVPRNKITKQLHDAYQHIRTHSLWQGVEYNMTKQISAYVEDQTWVDWNVITSVNLISLVEGEDHRITEFHKVDKAVEELDGVGNEAVVTVQCSNPINYLYTQFKNRYSGLLAKVKATYDDPMTQVDDFYRKMVYQFFEDPTELITALFCEGVVRVNPQIELSAVCPKVNHTLIKLLNIFDIETFHREVVSKLILAFGMGRLGYAVKRDESYKLEYYLSTNIMAIFEKKFTSLTEKYEEELLHSFIRGDFLPYEERKIAERLYIERPEMVLNLSQ